MINTHDAMRDNIVNTAREVFARFGYRKTTLDDIAAPLRKAKSFIYHYFAGKEDIFTAVLEREVEIAQEKVDTAIRNIASPPEKLRGFFHAAIAATAESQNYFSVLRDEWYEVFSFGIRIREQYMRTMIAKVSAILREGIARRDFEIDDIEATAEAIIISVGSLHAPWIYSPEEVQRKLDRVLSILIRGIERR
jgi:AcrR family transcriptional regulator